MESDKLALLRIQAEALVLIAKELKRIADFFGAFEWAWQEADEETGGFVQSGNGQE